MGAVGQVVDHEQARHQSEQGAFPLCIERVVVDHQPVSSAVSQGCDRVYCILLLRNAQPSRIRVTRSNGGRFERRGQQVHRETLGPDQMRHVPWVRAAHKFGVPPCRTGRYRQCKTAHHMASAHDGRCISPENDFQARCLPSIKASAAATPTVAPRHLNSASMACTERGCGHSRSSAS